jgi:hypothetical protein
MLVFIVEFLWHIIFPANLRELSISYLFGSMLYLSINIIWDMKSKYTPSFHFSTLKEKMDTLFNGVTCSSSFLVISSVFDAKTAEVVGASGIAYVLAGLSGILVSLSALCPYDAKHFKKKALLE